MNRIYHRALTPRERFSHLRHWLPWLIAALVLSGVFQPVVTTASHPSFQSALPYDQSPLPEAFLVQESPLQPAVELPLPADLIPQELPQEEITPPELPAPAPMPEALPQEEATPPQQLAPAPVEVPAPSPQPPAVLATPAIPGQTRPASSGLLIDEPVAQPPQPEQEKNAAPRISEFVINWTKFWDTLVLYASYPWLCCGILLLLGVPLAFLMLEIRGRRRPRVLPEEPTKKPQPPDTAPKQ